VEVHSFIHTLIRTFAAAEDGPPRRSGGKLE
jgi:hypothetical protein